MTKLLKYLGINISKETPSIENENNVDWDSLFSSNDNIKHKEPEPSLKTYTFQKRACSHKSTRKLQLKNQNIKTVICPDYIDAMWCRDCGAIKTSKNWNLPNRDK